MKRIGLERFKRVWNLCRPYHRYMVAVLAFLLVQQLVSVVSPIFFGLMVTAVTKENMQAFIMYASITAIIGVIRNRISYFRQRFEINNLDYDLSRYLSNISMKKFFDIDMGQHHVGNSIIKRSVIGKGEGAVSRVIDMGIYQLIPTMLSMILPLIFLLVKVPVVGGLVLITIVVFSIYTIKYTAKFLPELSELESLSNRIAKKQGEIIENSDIVYVNAQEERVLREYDNENETQGLKGKPLWLSYLVKFLRGQYLISIFQVACIVIAGYFYQGKITPGMFVTIFMWISSSLGTISEISKMQRDLTKSIAPIDKYFKFLDYKPEIVMPEKPIPIDYLRGRIEFRNVSFAYHLRTNEDAINSADKSDEDSSTESSEIPAVQDVSFLLEEGKRYAFVGKSGSGKSTLVSLILRGFDPQEGHVLIDGVDIRMLDFKELRRNVGLVPQDVALFDGTMRYNVTFGMNGNADKVTVEELDNIAKLSRVSEFYNKLENGWETTIGERGITLSGGQRQRVGIARALIKNPRILIFDEATSSLDTENEARIRESIQEASVGKTTIIVAHRLATVRDADKIFVFDEGKLVGQGPHEELLSTNEYYQRLVNNQIIMA